jgi:1-deoxy-D-xylulose-5-phosphate reductoisomerase
VSKRIAILGSTGSIGRSAIEVISHLGGDYRATALAAKSQIDLLAEQVRRVKPAAVAVADAEKAKEFSRTVSSRDLQVYSGASGLVDLVRRDDVDIVLAAVVGAAGLPAALEAVRAGKTLALANKESLVVAGSLLIPEARKRGVAVLPVDSEHSAIFQALRCGRRQDVRRSTTPLGKWARRSPSIRRRCSTKVWS